MNPSLHISSIAMELKYTLLTNPNPRTNFRALHEIEHALNELKGYCLYSTDKASQLFRYAKEFYRDQAAETDEKYKQMLSLAEQIDRAAQIHVQRDALNRASSE
ncbi:hypothetical protein [Marinobacterium rhizophilum]|uniref:Uncharacterized protein n=1 Tax=Marinobacterium rhizophilum TaxID=420402 RepID=A0ABY5HDK2_9GAMM|nr:hypothetical protein [Marinobacterium rhizophilum]UTW10407.1 hypothetical protein KDW95_13990 [Marinobacterium rhizophilum]